MNKRFCEKNRKYTSYKGFTLVEVLITVAIVAIIMGVMGTLFFSGATTYNEGSKKAYVQNDTRLGLELIQNEVRYAKALNLIGENFDPETNGKSEMSYITFKPTKENSGQIIIFSRNAVEGFDKMTLPGEYSNNTIFKVIDNGNTELVLLGIQVVGSYQGSDFPLETSINLLNMSSDEPINDGIESPLLESIAIEYLK